MLDPYLGSLTLNQINGDVIWSVVQGQLKKGNTPATVNRYLALIRNLLKWFIRQVRTFGFNRQGHNWFHAAP